MKKFAYPQYATKKNSNKIFGELDFTDVTFFISQEHLLTTDIIVFCLEIQKKQGFLCAVICSLSFPKRRCFLNKNDTDFLFQDYRSHCPGGCRMKFFICYRDLNLSAQSNQFSE